MEAFDYIGVEWSAPPAPPDPSLAISVITGAWPVFFVCTPPVIPS